MVNLLHFQKDGSGLLPFQNSGSFSRFVWRRYTLAAFIRLTLLSVATASAIALGGTLGAWISGSGDILVFGRLLRATVIVSALLIAQIGVGAALLLTDLWLRQAFFSDCANALAGAKPKHGDHASFDRACGRDILALADCLSSPVAAVASLLTICVGSLLFVFSQMGGSVALGLMFTVVLLVTWLLARQGIALSGRAADIGRLRMTLSSTWNTFGSDLLNWGLGAPLLARLKAVASLEVLVMNRETIVRALESFLTAFCLCFPLLAAAIFSWLTGNTTANALASSWAAIPILAAVLSYPLVLSECKRGNKHLQSLIEGLGEACSEENTGEVRHSVVFHDDSVPFRGSLARNVDPGEHDTELAIRLLTAFNLTEEIGSSEDATAVHSGGSNLSAGQISRLMLSRAMHDAAVRRLPLSIVASLSSIDDAGLHNGFRIAESLGVPVAWSAETISRKLSGREQKVDGGFSHKEITQPATSARKPIVRCMRKRFASNWMLQCLLFLPAAIASSCVAWVAALTQDSAASMGLAVFLVLVTGVCAGVTASYFAERKSRIAALHDHNELMAAVDALDSADFLQRVGRDYPTVLGRITWYQADIAWAAALMVVTVYAVVLGTKIIGVVLVAVWVAAAWALWKATATRVIQTRRTSVEGINDFLDHVLNLKWLDGISPPSARALRGEFAISGVGSLWRTQSQALIAKAALALYTTTLVNLLLCAIFSFNPQVGVAGTMVIIVTGLLAISGTSSQLTLALVGFSAQRVSIDRLKANDLRADSNIFAAVCGLEIRFGGFTDPVTGISYRETRWLRSRLYALQGPSGTGKSRFLDLIKESTRAQFTTLHVLRFPGSTAATLRRVAGGHWLKKLKRIIDEQPPDRVVVVLADEIFAEFPVLEAEILLQEVFAIVSRRRGVLIYVDHRLDIGTRVPIASIKLR